ncbi:hypothetical protein E4T56_gene11967 [Termitomyces sp. T112]|nr:hypothetical protein E4T56_gene11967 [Termitomyces sp. T112]
MSSENLDTLLRTTLLPGDTGYYELLCRRLAWWDSSRASSWSLENGYTLYHRRQHEDPDFDFEVYPPGVGPQESLFPYPYEGGYTDGTDPSIEDPPPFHAYAGHRATVFFALNRSRRHVALKAILAGSEELRILRRLQEQGVPRSMEDFHNVIPVLDLLPCEGHWLAIMPSYVSFNTLPDQVPADTSQGEFDFNPFAFDVGMLGVLFCHEFQYLTWTAPMLAPLLDRMTTRYIERRFKASEALQFFEEEVLSNTAEHVLSSSLPPRTATGAFDTFDRGFEADIWEISGQGFSGASQGLSVRPSENRIAPNCAK